MLTKLKANRKGWAISWGGVKNSTHPQLTAGVEARTHGYWSPVNRQCQRLLCQEIELQLNENIMKASEESF